MSTSIACVFPGQGSQSVGMLASLAAEHAVIENVFAEASEALGYDLWQLVQQDSEGKLNQTEYTQPALLAAGVAVWRVLQPRLSAAPRYFAGHSLGEYTALVCAEALSFADGIRLVAKRGQLMQQAVAEGVGAMAAIIGLAADKVTDCCDEASTEDSIVVAANYNAPGQIVISGHQTAVKSAMDIAKQQGAKLVKQLPLSVPSHCPLMRQAAEKLAAELAVISIEKPKITVLHNVDVQSHQEPAAIRNALVEQLYSPVQWIQTVEHLAEEKITLAIETGPGKVLTGLNKRITKTLTSLPAADALGLENIGENIGAA